MPDRSIVGRIKFSARFRGIFCYDDKGKEFWSYQGRGDFTEEDAFNIADFFFDESIILIEDKDGHIVEEIEWQ
jgi:hypothetical protein